jgi:hypothetical protein
VNFADAPASALRLCMTGSERQNVGRSQKWDLLGRIRRRRRARLGHSQRRETVDDIRNDFSIIREPALFGGRSEFITKAERFT